MKRLSQTLTPFILLAIAACASDPQAGTPADSAFPAEGPASVIREDAEDFVYFFPEDLDAENTWPANHGSADHEDPRGDGGVYREPMIAFLRWQLHGDTNGALWFTGASCVLCEDSSWSFDSK